MDPTAERFVLTLDDEAAGEPGRSGAKAAALSRIRRCGLPTLPGAVLTTELSRCHDAGTPIDELPAAAAVLGQLAPGGGAVIVRSSSTIEDGAGSSAAGQFESVLDVEGEQGLLEAVRTVYDSREQAGAADHPIAVLVQPMLTAELGGVYFGVDPVSGRSDRRVVTAVAGGPDRLVSGAADGSRWLLDAEGAVLESDERDGVRLDRGELARILEVGDRLAEVFAGPQDVEWAIAGGEVIVLQSRPVTSEVRGVPAGPVYGPGPVAETFPDPLAPLEVDLWIPPLRQGVVAALELSGAVPADGVGDRDVVVTVRGRAALDLEITGEHTEHRGRWRRMDPGGRLRRLRSAWRIGRMRVALPELADRLADQVDRDLERLPPLSELSTRQLVALLGRGQEALRSLHAHEILMGLVSDAGASRFTGASVALRVLAESRLEGLDDAEIIRRSPVVLALTPPRIGGIAPLPRAVRAPELPHDASETPGIQVRREALRLRVRWMQELTGQTATEIGRRLCRRGLLREPSDIARLRLEVVADVVARRRDLTHDLLGDAAPDPAEVPPLPARFQLGDRGLPISVAEGGRSGGGTGAGGGVAIGPVTHDCDDPPDGSVLVVGTLSPRLGPLLPRLAGLVAETGSVLAHLAILARESGVATVVGHRGALEDLRDGTIVAVDGSSGRVEARADDEAPRAHTDRPAAEVPT